MGRDINIARRKRRMSLADFASRMRMSQGTVIRLEKGEPGVSLQALAMALLALGEIRRLAIGDSANNYAVIYKIANIRSIAPDRPNYPGGQRCANIDAEPCKSIRQWWEIEFGKKGTNKTPPVATGRHTVQYLNANLERRSQAIQLPCTNGSELTGSLGITRFANFVGKCNQLLSKRETNK